MNSGIDWGEIAPILSTTTPASLAIQHLGSLHSGHSLSVPTQALHGEGFVVPGPGKIGIRGYERPQSSPKPLDTFFAEPGPCPYYSCMDVLGESLRTSSKHCRDSA